MENLDGMKISDAIQHLFRLSGIPDDVLESIPMEQYLDQMREKVRADFQELADQGIGVIEKSAVGSRWILEIP